MKVQNFKNPELKKFKSQNLHALCFQNIKMRDAIIICQIQYFEANFHPCYLELWQPYCSTEQNHLCNFVRGYCYALPVSQMRRSLASICIDDPRTLTSVCDCGSRGHTVS